MANRPAPALVLWEGDQVELERLTRASGVRAGLAQRARIVLLAAAGVGNTEIAHRVGVARQTVVTWRARYGRGGVSALHDQDRSGRPLTIDQARIITETLKPPPRSLGETHWSTRLLGDRLKVANSTIAKAWRAYGLQPLRTGSFRFSTDPELEAKVIDVVGLYLNPPQNAVVLCVDEKSQTQALERTSPILPMQPHLIERRSHDYRRHGTTTLFAALNVTGKITARCHPRHSHEEFLTFLRQVTSAYPRGEVHLVMDNYATHKHTAVKAWLATNPRVVVHFTPSHASWMNMVEAWFSMAERQALHRGSCRSVRGLTTTIRAYLDGWNERAHPFTWTKTADDVLKTVNRPGAAQTGH
ncbi:IS630 family transposase [Kineosporia sp. A_224]|uniref:IS630 family transposase n=1 Tax=Kineosporia sp. A_224 TaxID=1962180 RepID=UPI000B4AA68F|nr:IS630 family transposase [Kineosporia sp. A_224]